MLLQITPTLIVNTQHVVSVEWIDAEPEHEKYGYDDMGLGCMKPDPLPDRVLITVTAVKYDWVSESNAATVAETHLLRDEDARRIWRRFTEMTR